MSTAAENRVNAALPAKGLGGPAPAVTPAAAAPDLVNASFRLPRREVIALKQIAAIRNVSPTQALRQGLAILAFIVELPRGSRIFVRDPTGHQREVLFRNF